MQTVQPGPHLSVEMKSSGNVPLNESKDLDTSSLTPTGESGDEVSLQLHLRG